MKHSTDLKFWVEKLKSGEKFSMARWGDGELYCMWGKQGKNSNGCRYSPELREALLKAMVPKEGFYHGLQRVLPHDEVRIMKQFPDITWYETEIFSEAVAEGKLYPLLSAMSEKELVFIGNKSILPALEKIFWTKRFQFIEVQPSNAFDERERVLETIRWWNKEHPGKTYLFSCGMAANAFIYELHGEIDGVLMDLGHIWDPFIGLMSRCDLEGKTLEDINKNLHETN